MSNATPTYRVLTEESAKWLTRPVVKPYPEDKRPNLEWRPVLREEELFKHHHDSHEFMLNTLIKRRLAEVDALYDYATFISGTTNFLTRRIGETAMRTIYDIDLVAEVAANSEGSRGAITEHIDTSRNFAAIHHEQELQVLGALENPNYLWRTVEGLVTETGLDLKTVLAVLWQNRNRIVTSSRLSTTGQELYTTRQHHRQKASFWQKLWGAFRNRVD